MQRLWQSVVEFVGDHWGEPRRLSGLRMRWQHGERALRRVDQEVAVGTDLVEELRQDARARAIELVVERLELAPQYDLLLGVARSDDRGAAIEQRLRCPEGFALVSQCIQATYGALGEARDQLRCLERVFTRLWRDLAQLKVDADEMPPPLRDRVLRTLPELAAGVKSLLDRARDASNWSDVLLDTLDALVVRRPRLLEEVVQEETVGAPRC